MRQLWQIALGVVAGAGIVLLVLPHRGASPGAAAAQPPRAAAPAVPVASRAEVAALRSQVTALRDTLEAAPPELPPAAEAPADPDSQRAAADDIADRLDDAVAGEGADPSWAPRRETELADLSTTNALSGSHIAGVRCARRLCRLDVDHDDPTAADRFRSEAVHLPALQGVTGFVRVVPGDDGRSQSIVYVARRGHHLPLAPI